MLKTPTETIDWDLRDHLMRTEPWTAGDLLSEERTLAMWGKYRVVYGPFESPPCSTARVVLVGLTPGLSQLKLANDATREAMELDIRDWAEIGDRTRAKAAFAGSMRSNLVTMLDELGLPDVLGMDSTDNLFDVDCKLSRMTSALRFPVFVHGDKNYSGDDAITRAPALTSMLERLLAPQLCASPRALIVPFGPRVEAALDYLISHSLVPDLTILRGFPHPSGSNGHRLVAYKQNFESMRKTIEHWRCTAQ